MCRKYGQVLIYIITLLCIYYSIIFAEDKLKAENDKYVVKIKDIKNLECCPRRKQFTIEILDKKLKIKKEIFVPTPMEKDEIAFLHQEFETVNKVIITEQSKIIVLGKCLQERSDVILIVDIKSNVIEGTIWPGWESYFSPSNRFIVYEKSSRRVGGLILVYDFSKSFADNIVEKPEEGVVQFPIAGFPVYPETNVREKTYEIKLEESRSCLSPFLWSKDENKIIFVEYFEKEKQNYIVVVDIKGGLEKPRNIKRPIKFEDVLSISKEELDKKLTKETKEELKDRGFMFHIRNMWWEGADVVIMEPEYRECYLYEGYEFKIGEDKIELIGYIKDIKKLRDEMGINLARAKLSNGEDVFNFGKIKEGEKIKFRIIVDNRGLTELEIKKVDVPCDCVVVDVAESEKVVRPYEASVMDCEFDSTGKKGKIDYRIYIYTNDLENPKLEFKLIGEVE
jgi:hypothetical protein